MVAASQEQSVWWNIYLSCISFVKRTPKTETYFTGKHANLNKLLGVPRLLIS